ncbi:hypothetical protein ATY41_00020 [Leifsonia xyli subsp. xyli]|uniref:Uncharacterized protein n=1 Tax=Leifsonia xyli subsp. xyli TaxID=59736 RepID=A0A1E2SMZ5_LEIXY|nr:hypothetical protein [Leifsonia xyli]ODA91133.1 hypothetical protein ATY41_00020 [Leifsonia xyli subsp. xyli]
MTAQNAARSVFYSPSGGLATVSPSAKIRTTITLVSQPAGSTASIDWSGIPGVTASGTGAVSNPYVFDFALTTGIDEAFYRHPEWDFSTPGTYVFKVVASVAGPSSIAASDPVYYSFVATP